MHLMVRDGSFRVRDGSFRIRYVGCIVEENNNNNIDEDIGVW